MLRQINFADFRRAKSTILIHLEALNFDFYEFLHFLKAEIYQMNKIQSPKNGKNSIFRTSTFSKFAIFLFFGFLNYVFERFQPSKSAKIHKASKLTASISGEIADFAILDSTKLISRKIWVAEKS